MTITTARRKQPRVPRHQPGAGRWTKRERDDDTVAPLDNQEWRSGVGRPHPEGGYTDVIDTDGEIRYLRFGQYHNELGPAHTAPDGFEAWYNRGQLHRFDGPAMTEPGRRQEYWLWGKLHRDDGLPAVVKVFGGNEWWVQGVRQPDPIA